MTTNATEQDCVVVQNADSGVLNQKIKNQVEFYFSDANLPKDKFLKEESAKNNGWIPIQTIASFSRMKALSSDAEVIKSVLVSSDSDLFEVDSEGANVRRKIPLPEDLDLNANTVIVEGFPVEVTLDDISAFFQTHTNKIFAVRMHKDAVTKSFSGKANIVMSSPEEAKKLLDSAEPLVFKLGEAIHTLVIKAVPQKVKRSQPEFVYGRLVKIEPVPQAVTEISIKPKLIERKSSVGFVKRLQKEDEFVYVLLREPEAADLVANLKEFPIKLGEEGSEIELKASLIEEQEEEKRLIGLIEFGKPSNSKRRRH